MAINQDALSVILALVVVHGSIDHSLSRDVVRLVCVNMETGSDVMDPRGEIESVPRPL